MRVRLEGTAMEFAGAFIGGWRLVTKRTWTCLEFSISLLVDGAGTGE